MDLRQQRPGFSPVEFQSAQLVIEDFDNTVALTRERPPSGIGVEEAYRIAIQRQFGAATLKLYSDQGGLNNDDPQTVVQRLYPMAEPDEVRERKDALTKAKIEVLISSIGDVMPGGERWPRPTDGYLEMLTALDETPELRVDHAILSSGHHDFITATYDMWGVRAPEIIIATEVADDYAAQRGLDASPAKPDPILIAIALQKWRELYGVSSSASTFDTYDLADLHRAVLVGDDPVKDGELAKSYTLLDFFLIDPDNGEPTWQSIFLELLTRGASFARA